METVAFCEQDKFCQEVLAKHWPDIPCFDDIRTLKGADVGPVDLICGGYPCQPFSQAGQRRGAEDDRHLWPEMFRLIKDIRPAWVIGENVAGHISMGLDDVLSDLEGAGYACQAFVIPAVAVDAQHRRDRVWIVGHAASARRTSRQPGARGQVRDKARRAEPERRSGPVADPASTGREARRTGEAIPEPGTQQRPAGRCSPMANPDQPGPQERESIGSDTREELPAIERNGGEGWAEWLPEPQFRGIFDGLSQKLDGDRLDVDPRWLSVSCPQDAEGILRDLRQYEDALRPSYRRELDEQQSIEHSDAVQFLSHYAAPSTGGLGAEAIKAAMFGLWQALVSIDGKAMQYAPNEIEALWQPLTCAEADWCIVAACLGSFWSEWPEVPRTATGIPRRVDRLRALGNAVVPQIPEMIGHAIMETEK